MDLNQHVIDGIYVAVALGFMGMGGILGYVLGRERAWNAAERWQRRRERAER